MTSGMRSSPGPERTSDFTSTAIEIGYDKVTNATSEFTTGSGDSAKTYSSIFDSQLIKFTIAQQFHPKFGAWVRPVIRVFATYADWNTPEKFKDGSPCSSSSKACNALGLSYFDTGSTGQSIMDTFGSDSSGWTFGAQMEVWW